MQNFNLKDGYYILCEYKKTRQAFKHTAKLIREASGTGEDYQPEEILDECKICYLNRTWERYEYESVLSKMLDRIEWITPEEKKTVLERGSIDDPAMKNLKQIGMIASLGNILTNTKEESNDWKKRMLKAGLEGRGLIMPEDWDELSEDDKQKRLDGAIKQITS